MASQIGQCDILAHFQACQLVVGAVQNFQCRILAHVKACQLVGVAVQPLQFRVLAHIKACQLVVVAFQIGQCRILAQVKAGQLVGVAGKIDQCREMFHAREVGDSHIGNIDSRCRCDLMGIKNIIIGRVEVCVNVGAEDLIREVLFIDHNIFHIRHSDRTGGFKAVFIQLADVRSPCKGILCIGSCIEFAEKFPCNCKRTCTVLCLDFNRGREQCDHIVRCGVVFRQCYILGRSQTRDLRLCGCLKFLCQGQCAVLVQCYLKALSSRILVKHMVVVGSQDYSCLINAIVAECSIRRNPLYVRCVAFAGFNRDLRCFACCGSSHVNCNAVNGLGSDRPADIRFSCEIAGAADGERIAVIRICGSVAGDDIVIFRQSKTVYCNAVDCLCLFGAIVDKSVTECDLCAGNVHGVYGEVYSRFALVELSYALDGCCCCSGIYIVLIRNGIVRILHEGIAAADNLNGFKSFAAVGLIIHCGHHILSQRTGNRCKCKDFSIAVAELVSIANVRCRVGNSQYIALNSRIEPYGNLCHIKALR